MTKELKTLLIIGGSIVAIIAILVGVSQFKAGSKPIASEAVIREDSHVTGPENAKVTLVEFGDYQCPACASSEPMIKQLIAAYPNDLRFSFRNFPLLSIHPNAMDTAKAAEAAALQGKFWEMHDLLYEQQNVWANLGNPDDQLKAYAEQLDLDVNKFMSDYRGQATTDRVNRDFNDGGALGVNATPTFYVNGEKVQNASYEELKKQIDAIIAQGGDDESDQESTPSATPTEAAQP
jgi:protein-disulfide isomerase